jgi:hypothetical protein
MSASISAAISVPRTPWCASCRHRGSSWRSLRGVLSGAEIDQLIA